MKNIPFYLKSICVFLFVTIFASCESESINEETGINEQDKLNTYQIDKEDVLHPDDREN